MKVKSLFTVVNNYCFVFGHIFLITFAIYFKSNKRPIVFFLNHNTEHRQRCSHFPQKFPHFKHHSQIPPSSQRFITNYLHFLLYSYTFWSLFYSFRRILGTSESNNCYSSGTNSIWDTRTALRTTENGILFVMNILMGIV